MIDHYIDYVLFELKPKTGVYRVFNKKSGITLGIIKWYPAWRQYCFFPLGNTIFSKGCLDDIIKITIEITKGYKKNSKIKGA